MPIYNFYCCNPKCDHEEEIFLKHVIKDEENITTCSKCGAKMEREIFAPMQMKIEGLGNYSQPPNYNNEKPEWNYRRKKKLEQKEGNK